MDGKAARALKGGTRTPRLAAAQRSDLVALLGSARRQRLTTEPGVSDTVVLQAPAGAETGGPEDQALATIASGDSTSILGGVHLHSTPRLEFLRRQDHAVLVHANPAARLALLRNRPGLEARTAAWLYPQFVRPFVDGLEDLRVDADPRRKARRIAIVLTSSVDGTPIIGAEVKAFVDLDPGRHVAAVSDANGVARIVVPIAFRTIELVFIQPRHTFWSAMRGGFERVAAPRRLSVALRPLIPDAFGFLGHYATYDERAGAGVTVGIVDSGVGPHRDLQVAGANLVANESDRDNCMDNGLGHGTHVAGIIAARRSADGSMFGLAPSCTLRAYRVFPRSGHIDRALSTDVAAAIERAVADGCDLVNLSLGSRQDMPGVQESLNHARNAGVAVFAATGNDGIEGIRYPARYSHALAVGAFGRDGTIPADCPEILDASTIRNQREFVAAFSNYGDATAFVGPGVGVISTFPGDLYAMLSGTSMATPFATGMAARLLSCRPDILTMPRNAARTDAIVALVSGAARAIFRRPPYEGFGIVQ